MRSFLIVVLVAAITTTAAASDLGSVVNSFPARIPGYGHNMMPVGMEYAFNNIWFMYADGVLAERSYTTGSVIATYVFGPRTFRGLAFDGTYFWTAYSPYPRPSVLYKISATTMSVVATYGVNFEYTLHHLTWDGTQFWVNFLDDFYFAHRMNEIGSILDTLSIPYKLWAGVAYAGNIPDGPKLFEGAWSTSPRRVYVYKMPERVFQYMFSPRIPEPVTKVGCWDGTYLWVFGNWSMAGNEYSYQIIGWEPGIGVTPASIGKVKALFR